MRGEFIFSDHIVPVTSGGVAAVIAPTAVTIRACVVNDYGKASNIVQWTWFRVALLLWHHVQLVRRLLLVAYLM